MWGEMAAALVYMDGAQPDAGVSHAADYTPHPPQSG